MIPTLRLPPGHSAMNSPPASFALSADGSAFYGVQTKINDKNYAFRVYHQLPVGTATPIETGIGGQGQFQETGGLLVASGCVEVGDGKPVVPFVVPGFVAGPGAAPILLAHDGAVGKLYRGEYNAADFDTPAEIALRVGKLLRAFVQFVDDAIGSGAARWG